MTDPFSVIAGVLSVADVAVRTCERLRDLTADLRDGPQSVQRLRQTIQKTKSVLRNVWVFVSEFNSSILATEYHQVLPEAVERSLEQIRDDLTLLENLLAKDESRGDTRKRIGHASRKKATGDIVERLESQQRILTLALQSAEQRRGTKLHSDVLSLGKDLREGQANTTCALLEAEKKTTSLLEGIFNKQRDVFEIQNSSIEAVEDLSRRITDSHAETSAQLIQLQSDIRLDQEHMRTPSSLQALPESALRPAIRAELKRIVIPVVEEAFRQKKSRFDQHMDRTQQDIDRAIQNLGSMLKDQPTSREETPDQIRSQSARQEMNVRPGYCYNESEILSSERLQREKYPDDHLARGVRTWTYRLSIGFVCIRVSTSRTRSKKGAKSEAFGPSTSAWSEELYDISISFQPADCILSRGILLTTGSRSDQNGYYFRCPEISTFAVIPRDSKVFELAVDGDLQGLRTLFVKNLASPSDRDKYGYTVLHYAIMEAQINVCEFLVNESADQCLRNELALDCLAFLNCVSLSWTVFCESREGASDKMINIRLIARLLLRKGCDADEANKKTFLWDPTGKTLAGIPSRKRRDRFQRSNSEEPLWQDDSHCVKAWLDFLRDQNLDIDNADDADASGLTLLHRLIWRQVDICRSGGANLDIRLTESIFILCVLGADVSARDPDVGAQPLHMVATISYSPERAFYVRALFEILLKFGADPCARDDDGFTVTDYAIYRDWGKQWVEALRKCNKLQTVLDQLGADLYGPMDAPLDNAMCTGVDTTDLGKPPIGGLSRRIVAIGDRLDD